LTVKNRNTPQTTAEQAAELVTQIIRPGDDEAAGALAALVSALADIGDEGARQEIAVAVAERAYARTDAYGNALLAFTRGDASRIYAESSR
jgi:hypothetical protein